MIKSCPFCGSNDTKLANAYRQHGNSEYKEEFHVLCNNCEASAGYCDSKVAAVKKWNQRAEIGLFD